MLYGLMGGAVLTHGHAVVGEHIDDRQFHQGRQSNGGADVIGKDQECAAVGADAPVQKHAGHDGAHGKLTDAEADVAAVVMIFLKLRRIIDKGFVGGRQIG